MVASVSELQTLDSVAAVGGSPEFQAAALGLNQPGISEALGVGGNNWVNYVAATRGADTGRGF